MAKLNPNNEVETPSTAYKFMEEEYSWHLICCLLAGTRAMREAGPLYLPQESKEDDEAYRCRLYRSFLYNGFEDTVTKLGGKPFSKPVTIKGEDSLDARLDDLLDDVDRTKRDITTFAQELFTAGVAWGLTHVVVDYPKLPAGATLADEKQAGARPILIHVPPQNLIGWRSETLPNGEERLTMIRFKECKVEDDGMYGDREVHRIRVFTQTTWEVWEQQMVKTKTGPREQYVKVEEGTHTLGEVPLLTFYAGKRTGFMMAVPPLLSLAWLNLEHWQSSSDQRNILRFARVGLLFAAGFSEEEVEKGIVIGPSKLIATSNPNGKLAYVEHTGKAIESGERDLQKLQDQMEVLGLQPLVEKAGDSTATGKAIDEGKTLTAMQTWVMKFEGFLKECVKLSAKWLKIELPEDFVINVYNDFSLANRGTTDLDTLNKARQQGDIDRETYLNEIKRRGVLAEDVKVQDVMDKIDQEGPALGTLSSPTPGVPPEKTKPAPKPPVK